MSDIEAAGQALISDMIRGRPVTLDLRVQETVGTWLALKAIVAREIEAEAAPVPRDVREAFFRDHRPPNTWHAWIGRYDGSLPVYIGATDVTSLLRHKLAAPRASPGVLGTFVIGYFVAQVFGLADIVPIRYNQNLLVEVWPHPLLSAAGYAPTDLDPKSWPPAVTIDDSVLERMSNTLPHDL